MLLGYGHYQYERVEGWGQGDQGHQMGVVSDVAVDSQDRVYILDRDPRPAVVVFDRDGRLLDHWGQDIFGRPHGIWIGPDDRLYIADWGDHTVRICGSDGQVIKILGTPGRPGKPGQPFNGPTCAVLSPWGDLYVSDGYGQHRVHRFSPDGTLVQSWGTPGSGPGQFTLPHNVCIDHSGRVLVADREPNNRIQMFDSDGAYLDQWPGRLMPNGLFVDQDNVVYVTEGECVSIFDPDGRLLSYLAVRGGPEHINHASHGIWVDRHGDIYVCQVGAENLFDKFVRRR